MPYESRLVDRLGMSIEELDAYGDLLDPGDDRSIARWAIPTPSRARCSWSASSPRTASSSADPEGYRDPRVLDLGPGADDWHLLLQVDSDDAADMMWGDLGRIYFWIRDEDLAARRFDAPGVVLQCG